MNDDLYTQIQKKYMKAKDLKQLNSILGDIIMAETILMMNHLSIYKNLKKPTLFDSLFGNKKLQNEYQVCANLMAKFIAILFNSIRNILYTGLTKQTTENVFKSIIIYIGEILPAHIKFKFKNKQDLTRYIYSQVVNHNFPKLPDSFQKDLDFLEKVYPGNFSEQEILKIKEFSSDSWIRLYPHTYITHFKKHQDRGNKTL